MEDKDIILQTKDSMITLTADNFIYKDTIFPIKSMKQASLKEGNYRKSDMLQIEFKDGTTKEFFFKPTTTFKELLAVRLIPRLSYTGKAEWETIQRNMAAQILDWAVNINELIKKKST